MMTIARGTVAAALVAAGLLSLGLSACSSKGDSKSAAGGAATSAGSGAPSMSAADLQKSLAGRISTATPPKSVTCPDGLAGDVGKTASCEVVVNDTTAVQVTVTVTKVNGTAIDYDFAPSMTKAQLEQAFSANVNAQVTCDAGLDGKVGSSTTCQVTKDGTTNATTVSVSKVQGLFMSLATASS